ncbi:hypothetical protein [Primorskyibacter sp. 2E233]|uniref:hypothetical protein n=1 Tax=Primorskyibacter sp. 2E233 TaxID=3413431 RepID=UPI003BF38C71
MGQGAASIIEKDAGSRILDRNIVESAKGVAAGATRPHSEVTIYAVIARQNGLGGGCDRQKAGQQNGGQETAHSLNPLMRKRFVNSRKVNALSACNVF